MKARQTPTRRQFLAEVSRGTLAATIGPALALELGFLPGSSLADSPKRLKLGKLESLAHLLEDTPVEKLQPILVAKIKSSTSLQDLVGAAALANARRFGGEDYVGFHTFMALQPALKMATMLPEQRAALPVLKVLYRNTARMQESDRKEDSLSPLEPAVTAPDPAALHALIRAKDQNAAERGFASLSQTDPNGALTALIKAVSDNPEVHRTVLPYRAWDMAQMLGPEYATTLLRQSLRYCLYWERSRTAEWDKHGKILTTLLDEHKLHGLKPGNRQADDAWVQNLAHTFATGSPDDAAKATATALAEGFQPTAIGEALSLAASHLVLTDGGRPPQWEAPGKPPGSVHGDSVGVHASDAVNAWRHLSTAGDSRNLAACLIMASWVMARDRGEWLLKEPLPTEWLIKNVKGEDATSLTAELKSAIQGNQQAHAVAIVHRMGQLNLPEKSAFNLLLEYAVSEDGALHAEKYFHTVWDDFNTTRPTLRWQHLSALARVTASEYGRPAPGQQEARELLLGT